MHPAIWFLLGAVASAAIGLSGIHIKTRVCIGPAEECQQKEGER